MRGTHRLVNHGYKPELINKHIKTVEKIDGKELLKERDSTTLKETRISLVLTRLPNISKVVRKHWNILSIKRFFKMEQ